MTTKLFSIIIPVRIKTLYLQETLKALRRQSIDTDIYEIIIVTDKMSGVVSPAQKRNLGAAKSKGLFLVFLDDDSYPHPDFLVSLQKQISLHSDYAAFCGPCLTPPSDNIFQQASGIVWSSYLGSGGAGAYRNQVAPSRIVDDYPSVNLTVNKKVFQMAGGFNTHHWPGEDTILCHDVVYKLGKKILYHPSVIVYHHRRPIILPHLQQITRYALHRGNFARILPKTSFRLGYLIPSIFVLYLILLLFFRDSVLLIPLYLYLVLLSLSLIDSVVKFGFIRSLLGIVMIPITHIYYGILFFIGFFTPSLKFHPHQIKSNSNEYDGG